ncbi:hypothetical protein CAL29_20500 [Bordetella genomosp. 10]|uniref:DUF2486 domain-containing protein n=1 Tax=Bordetella genomosp. 10 TaxID=1416804 RepID=A0A261RZR8_9BORD|nr:hypothetical protein [Bordetella genomosp. 10]OZI30415.1 hypothetical protein CAL29_20500 [Bordetella genomosp. 10]
MSDTRDDDPAIPTLTIQAGPARPAEAPAELPPLLTEVVERGAARLPPDPVLRAALQAELEHMLAQALERAMAHVREEMEAELPAAVTRVVSRLRPG